VSQTNRSRFDLLDAHGRAAKPVLAKECANTIDRRISGTAE
jgi:3-deoxy-D-arabino-heptulosonate 7-phosphate (DAHP) synthase